MDAFVRSTARWPAAGSDPGGSRRDRARGWTGSAVGALGRMHPAPAIALVATAVALAWVWPYLGGGANHVPPHWFYVPVLLAAARFGIAGAIVTAVVSGVVAGPLLPADVAQGARQLPSDELMRAVAFLAIGTLMAAILRRLEASLRREAGLARRETELAAHKAAVISTVSHEFRTPLTVLLGTSRMLLSRAGEADADRALLEGVDSAARRLNDLVVTVLAVSEGPHSAEDRITTATRLREVVAAVAVSADPRNAARLRVEVGDALVWTTPAVLETLLRQLVANALRFSPPDAEVRIVDRRAAEDRLEVAVLDRGPGIDPTFIPKAFEPFTQQDPSGTRSSGGLGIGLFVAHRLAERLGVDLDLRNREGGGTEAVVRLPRADWPAVADAARS